MESFSFLTASSKPTHYDSRTLRSADCVGQGKGLMIFWSSPDKDWILLVLFMSCLSPWNMTMSASNTLTIVRTSTLKTSRYSFAIIRPAMWMRGPTKYHGTAAQIIGEPPYLHGNSVVNIQQDGCIFPSIDIISIIYV